MEVILLERVGRLGALGDKVTVKDGYARNFLLPKGKALRATKDNVAVFETRKAEIAKQNEEKRTEAQKQASTLDNTSVIIIRQSGEEGRLFGSVSARDIANAIAEKNKAVTHQMVTMVQAIKDIGVYPVKVMLHPEVAVTVKVAVARTESEGKDALDGKVISVKRGTKLEEDEADRVERKAAADARRAAKAAKAAAEAGETGEAAPAAEGDQEEAA
ncbi:50S ribosomal protein L9 [bacterium]|nr:50S ribosomal protein L9 [bacterium]